MLVRGLVSAGLARWVLFTHTKRRRSGTWTENSEDPSAVRSMIASLKEKLVVCNNFRRNLTQPIEATDGVFNLQHGDRIAMMDWLWAGDYDGVFSDLKMVHPDILEVLKAQTASTYRPEDPQLCALKETKRLNWAMGMLVRNQNVHNMPKAQVRPFATQSAHAS